MKIDRAGFWKSDWFLGVAVSIAILIAGGSDLLQSLERKAYDLAVGMVSRQPSDKIAVIAIDKQSIDNIGRWPWSREIQAEMIEKLAAAKAKVIATTVFYSEPQLDAGLGYVNKLIGIYGEAGGLPLTATPEELSAQPALLGQMAPVLAEAEQKLNTDRRLAAAIGEAGNVALPMLFRFGEPLGRPDKDLPEYIQKYAVKGAGGDIAPVSVMDVDAGVLEPLGRNAAVIGHLDATFDVDGAIRTEPLLVNYFGQLYPSLSLLVAAKSLNLTPADILAGNESVKLGRLKIGTDPALRMYTFFYKDRDAGQPAFPVDSFFDVKTGKIPMEKYRDKIVLIGPTAAGVGSTFVTPVSAATPSVLLLAHTISSVLSEHFFVAPSWGIWVELAVFLLVAAYLVALLPRLKAGTA
ncbi:MAG TPA: CHASE2 domain-containing protein, partial [Rhodocyclaceae bacterium]